jgi:hypothetical protein
MRPGARRTFRAWTRVTISACDRWPPARRQAASLQCQSFGGVLSQCRGGRRAATGFAARRSVKSPSCCRRTTCTRFWAQPQLVSDRCSRSNTGGTATTPPARLSAQRRAPARRGRMLETSREQVSALPAFGTGVTQAGASLDRALALQRHANRRPAPIATAGAVVPTRLTPRPCRSDPRPVGRSVPTRDRQYRAVSPLYGFKCASKNARMRRRASRADSSW